MKRSIIVRVLIVVGVVVVGAIGGVVFTLTGAKSGEDQVTEAQPELRAQSVRLEPTSSSGSNPFMAPVGEDQSNVAAPEQAKGQFAGDTPGLFAEGGDKPSCSTSTLLTNLQADQSKAGAWAQALSIRTEDIAGFVQGLSPVLLRADTAVTEHGYDSGTFVAYPAVLQAGTAVFVNGFGEPTVKCYSGNPLTRPADIPQAPYEGTRWAHFQPVNVTYITPAPTVIKVYNYYNITKKVIIVKQSPCSAHPDWKGCQRPGPVWCGHGVRCAGPPPDCDKVDCKRPVECVQAPCTKPGGGGLSPRQAFCKANPKQCDPDGIPIACKGVAGPAKDPICNAPGGKPDGKPDPVMAQKAEEAQKAAEEAAAQAKQAADNARQFEINARNADADARSLEQIAQDKKKLLAANPNDPALQQAVKDAEAAAQKAREAANVARQQAEFQAKAAHAVEQTSKQAQEAAQKAKDEADQSAGRPDHPIDPPQLRQGGPDPEEGTAAEVKLPNEVGPQGGQQPAGGTPDGKGGTGTPPGGAQAGTPGGAQVPGPASGQPGQAGQSGTGPAGGQPGQAGKPGAGGQPGQPGQAGSGPGGAGTGPAGASPLVKPAPPVQVQPPQVKPPVQQPGPPANPCLAQPKPPACQAPAGKPAPAEEGGDKGGDKGGDNGGGKGGDSGGSSGGDEGNNGDGGN